MADLTENTSHSNSTTGLKASGSVDMLLLGDAIARACMLKNNDGSVLILVGGKLDTVRQ